MARKSTPSFKKSIDFKRLRFIDGDVLVIREHPGEPTFRHDIMNSIKEIIKADVGVVFVPR